MKMVNPSGGADDDAVGSLAKNRFQLYKVGPQLASDIFYTTSDSLIITDQDKNIYMILYFVANFLKSKCNCE